MAAVLGKDIIAPYCPLPWQEQAWRDRSKVLVCTGTAGGGKSRLACEKVHGYMLKYPGAMGLMVRKTREAMTNSTLLFYERVVRGRDPRVHHIPSKHRYEYNNGSILAYGGMKDEQQREQIRSMGAAGGVDFVWAEEANKLTEDDFGELVARLRGQAARWQQVILSTNPDMPGHWIKARMIDGKLGSVHYSSYEDNPYNPADYGDTLDLLPGVLKLRLKKGLWVRAEGMVYDVWSPQWHIVSRFEIPDDWRRIRAIDFGYRNPFVCQWWTIDGDDVMYRYRELYGTGRTVAAWADEIKRVECEMTAEEWAGLGGDEKDGAWYENGEHVEATVTDHDASDRADLEAAGIDTVAANKALTGLQHVEARLRPDDSGRCGLCFLEDSLIEADPALIEKKLPTCTEQEFETYVWPRDAGGQSIKEVPVKKHDHGMDAMRYAVMYVDSHEGGRSIFAW